MAPAPAAAPPPASAPDASAGPGPAGLRIILVDGDSERSAVVEQELAAGGYRLLARLPPGGDLAATVRLHQPDVIIIDAECPDRDTLENMRAVGRDVPRPIVMFVDRSDDTMTRQAIEAGVSAYVVAGLNRQSVRPVVEVAIARFREFQAVRDELARTRSALEERKVIERAKGILMQQRGWTEDQAYRALRKMAMERSIRVVEVARSLIMAVQMLKESGS